MPPRVRAAAAAAAASCSARATNTAAFHSAAALRCTSCSTVSGIAGTPALEALSVGTHGRHGGPRAGVGEKRARGEVDPLRSAGVDRLSAA